jgi:Cytochrome b5-like Heme/Steroid binding domain
MVVFMVCFPPDIEFHHDLTAVHSCFCLLHPCKDVTSYASSHPGGSALIYSMCGVDGTSSFKSQHSGKNYMSLFTTYKGTFSTNSGSTNAPTSAPADGVYTSNDLAAHSTPSDCWTVVNGDVYGKKCA